MGDGKRPLDARDEAAAREAMKSLPRDVQEEILEKARPDLIVGADRCQNMECANAGTKRCARCKLARYCSKECQAKDWTARHAASCGRVDGETNTAKAKAEASGSGVTATMMGYNMGGMTSTPISMQAFTENMEAGKTGGWYAGVPRERLYERLMLSFALRVDDEYSILQELRGAYLATADGEELVAGDMNSSVMGEFRRYLARAKANGILPNDWTPEDEQKTLERAAAEDGIRCAYEKSDIVKTYGYASGEHMVLRSIAEHAIGRSVMTPGEWV
jgi:hypothetical protein